MAYSKHSTVCDCGQPAAVITHHGAICRRCRELQDRRRLEPTKPNYNAARRQVRDLTPAEVPSTLAYRPPSNWSCYAPRKAHRH